VDPDFFLPEADGDGDGDGTPTKSHLQSLLHRAAAVRHAGHRSSSSDGGQSGILFGDVAASPAGSRRSSHCLLVAEPDFESIRRSSYGDLSQWIPQPGDSDAPVGREQGSNDDRHTPVQRELDGATYDVISRQVFPHYSQQHSSHGVTPLSTVPEVDELGRGTSTGSAVSTGYATVAPDSKRMDDEDSDVEFDSADALQQGRDYFKR